MDCKNCLTYISDKSDYCYSCGGKIIRNRLTMHNLFEHFSETFFNYDNKFLLTFIGLFRYPEVIIASYIDGTRKRYVNVVSYFAIAITLSGFQMYFLNKFFPNAMDISSIMTKDTENLKGNDIMISIQEFQSIIMMLYVPLYAIIGRLVFLNKKTYNYTEQLVIYMYIQAQISIASAIIMTFLVIFGFNFFDLSFYYLVIMIAYAAYCLKRLYKLTVSELILKILIFLLIMGILMVFLVIAMLVIKHLNGTLPGFIEAQKAA